jgi:glucuronokinase
VHHATVPARAGLAGNPSDGYAGAAVAVPVPALTAGVEIVDASEVRVVGPAGGWADVGALVEGTGRYGHEGGGRLVTAAIATMARQVGEWSDTFEVRWATTIPRSVGLAGSSALVIATMQALAARWSVTVDALALARLALAAEVHELGITAGLVDRAVQALGAPALVDRDAVRALDVTDPPRLAVAWKADAGGPSHRVHGPLRQRFDAGDDAVVGPMALLASTGRRAARALEAGDHDALADCVRSTWIYRCSLGIVGADAKAMVDALDVIGVAATSAGSGGAVVAVLPAGVDAEDVRGALGARCDDVVAVGPQP